MDFISDAASVVVIGSDNVKESVPNRRLKVLERQLGREVESREGRRPCPRALKTKHTSSINETISGRCEREGLPFEAWYSGLKMTTKRRTISEFDVLGFTQTTGYFNEKLFSDDVYRKEVALHPRRLVPALLTASIADGLIISSGIIEGFAIALLGIENLKAMAPVYAGDTLYVELVTLKVTSSKSKPDRGIVTTKQFVKNVNGIVVLEYTVSRMLRRSRSGNAPSKI